MRGHVVVALCGLVLGCGGADEAAPSFEGRSAFAAGALVLAHDATGAEVRRLDKDTSGASGSAAPGSAPSSRTISSATTWATSP